MARDSAETGRFRPLFLLALCVALPMVLFDTIDGVNFLGDIDDQLRAVQIRLLVEGGSWFDRTIPMIQMPEAYVSPGRVWSICPMRSSPGYRARCWGRITLCKWHSGSFLRSCWLASARFWSRQCWRCSTGSCP
jgi:hypothetical protein